MKKASTSDLKSISHLSQQVFRTLPNGMTVTEGQGQGSDIPLRFRQTFWILHSDRLEAQHQLCLV